MGPVLILAIALVTGTAGQTDAVRQDEVVRTTASALAEAVVEGRQRSPTFEALLDQLAHSDLIVYLQPGACPDRRSIACLSVIGRTSTRRLVLITLVMQSHGDRTILSAFNDHLIAHIGHELRHALEVAQHSAIEDGATLEAAYRRWGMRPDSKSTSYDSDQAIRTGESVLRELHGVLHRDRDGR